MIKRMNNLLVVAAVSEVYKFWDLCIGLDKDIHVSASLSLNFVDGLIIKFAIGPNNVIIRKNVPWKQFYGLIF